MALFVGQVICFIKYAIDGLYYLRKYIFNLTQEYAYYIGDNGNNLKNNINIPPKRIKRRKRRKKKTTTIIDLNYNSSLNKNILFNSNNDIHSQKKMSDYSEKRCSNINKSPILLIENKNISKFNKIRPESKFVFNKNQKYTSNIKITINEKINGKINMEEYLSLSFDENDFDDVIEKET